MTNPFVQETAQRDPDVGFAVVTGVTADGLLIRLDEETEAGDKAFKRLDSYSNPVEGDRVFFRRVSGSILILGKVV